MPYTQAPISAGAAEFNVITNPITAAAEALTGATTGAKLLPGSYQLAAAYSGNGVYLPTKGSATLVVGATCPLVSLTA